MPNPTEVPPLFPERGCLMSSAQIATLVFNGTKSPQWVRRNVAPSKKLRLGHSTVLWWERDVVEWLDGVRGAA